MAKVALLSPNHTVYDLSVRALSSYLKQQGHDVTVVHLSGWKRPSGIVGQTIWRREPYSPKLLARLAEQLRGCQLIGITATAMTKDRAVALIDALRPLGVPIVWGGIFATTCPEVCLEHVDIVCIGEGEGALAELVERIERRQPYDDVRNLWVRRDGVVHRNEVRPLIQDLDALPFSDYDLASQLMAVGDTLRPSEARDLYGGWVLIHGTRGCPFNCSYCCNRSLQELYGSKKLRYRSADSLIDELAELRAQNPSAKLVWFTDDDFFARPLSDLKRFAVEYRRRIGATFICYASPNTVREDKLELLLHAGLKRVLVGVQTGSDRVNKEVYKRASGRDRVLRAAKILHKYRRYMRPPEYSLIACNPLETANDLRQTFDLVRELPRGYILMSNGLTLFPGTELRARLIDEGAIDEADASRFDLQYHELEERLRTPTPEGYLQSLLYWMNGSVTPLRYGIVPAPLLDLLLDERVVALNQRFRTPHLAVNRMVALRWQASQQIFMLLKNSYMASPVPLQRLAHRLFYRQDYQD